MIETDQFAAAAKLHKLKEQAKLAKHLRRQKEKKGIIDFKSDEESDNENPYDSEDERYEQAAKD
jgi:hypothetical protein